MSRKKFKLSYLILAICSEFIAANAQTNIDLSIRNQHVMADTFLFDIYFQRSGQNNIYLQNSDFIIYYDTSHFSSPSFGYLNNSSQLKNSLGQTISYGNNISTQLGSGFNQSNLIINVIKYVGSQNDFDNTVAEIDTGTSHKLGTFYITGINDPAFNGNLEWVLNNARGLATTVFSMATSTPFSSEPVNILNAAKPTPSSQPTINSASISFGNVEQSCLSLYINNIGNGSKRLILAKEGEIDSIYPGDGLKYTADNIFSKGDEVGNTGAYVVYNGTGDSVHITGLTHGTTYYFAVFEYNGDSGKSENYYTPGIIASQATDASYITVNIKVFLEGPFIPSQGKMSTTLNATGIIPLSQPYNVSPWNYGGNESVTSIPNSNIVDWVLVEIRSGTASNTVVAKQACFLLNDGNIVSIDGVSLPQFSGISTGNYYVVVRHNRHLAVMTAGTVSLSPNTSQYNFSTSASNFYGSGGKASGSYYVLYAGDVNGSGTINAVDIARVKSRFGQSTYLLEDVNMSASMNAVDLARTKQNAGNATFVP